MSAHSRFAGNIRDVKTSGRAEKSATCAPFDELDVGVKLGVVASRAFCLIALGFEAVLTPTGTFCEDAWVTTAALSMVTERLKFLVAFRPGFVSPTLAASTARTGTRLQLPADLSRRRAAASGRNRLGARDREPLG